jgi:hypothetical protein
MRSGLQCRLVQRFLLLSRRTESLRATPGRRQRQHKGLDCPERTRGDSNRAQRARKYLGSRGSEAAGRPVPRSRRWARASARGGRRSVRRSTTATPPDPEIRKRIDELREQLRDHLPYAVAHGMRILAGIDVIGTMRSHSWPITVFHCRASNQCSRLACARLPRKRHCG